MNLENLHWWKSPFTSGSDGGFPTSDSSSIVWKEKQCCGRRLMEIAAGIDWFYCFPSHWLPAHIPATSILCREIEAEMISRTNHWLGSADIRRQSGSLEKAFINPQTAYIIWPEHSCQDVQYMAEFDPEVCERNRQSRLHKGEVLRPQVLVAHTQRLKGSSRVTNARRTIFYQAPQPPLFFASETICPTVRRQWGKKKSSSFSTVLQQDEWKNKLTPNIVKIHTQTGQGKVLHQTSASSCCPERVCCLRVGCW